MTLLQAFILGLVEGLTEYLPISSTGHLILVAAALGLDSSELKRNMDAFEIVIQSGAILAVLGLYRHRVGGMLAGLAGKDAAGQRLLTRLLLAFLPAAVLGLVFGRQFERLFSPGPVLAALALGGIAMIVLARLGLGARPRLDGLDSLGPRAALVVGLVQCLAFWPGMSRSMVTIVAGLAVGLRAGPAAEFSFLLGLPTLGAACGYKLAIDLLGPAPGMVATLGLPTLVTGLGVAALSAALAVRWLVGFLGRHGLEPFGWYRLGLSGLLALCVWQGWLRISP